MWSRTPGGMPREPGVQMADPAADHGGPAAGPGRRLLSLLGRAASGLSFEQESFCRKRFPVETAALSAAAIRHTVAALAHFRCPRLTCALGRRETPMGRTSCRAEPSRAAGTRSARRRCHSAIVSTRKDLQGCAGCRSGARAPLLGSVTRRRLVGWGRSSGGRSASARSAFRRSAWARQRWCPRESVTCYARRTHFGG
jgi:hypothetical protein